MSGELAAEVDENDEMKTKLPKANAARCAANSGGWNQEPDGYPGALESRHRAA